MSTLSGGVSSRVDLRALIGNDTTLVAKLRGKEYQGPCPKCGGSDRFTVNTEKGWWFCRHCQYHFGDAPGYLMWRDGISYARAMALLEGGAVPQTSAAPEPRAALSAADREVYGAIAADCHALLVSPRGAARRAWLAARGITDACLLSWCLGYHPGPDEAFRTLYGRRVYTGYTIPLYAVDGQIHGLQVRQQRPADEKRASHYISVKGSHLPLYGRRGRFGKALLLVESYLDAVLLTRVVGDLVDVAAVGSAFGAVEDVWHDYLLQHGLWLVALDNDQAGDRAATIWLASDRRAARVTYPDGYKDPGEWWAKEAARWDAGEADLQLRQWVQAALGAEARS